MMFWNGNMGGWGYVLMVASFVLFWSAVIAAIVLLAKALGPASPGRNTGLNSGSSVGSNPRYAEDLLAERFALGEIDESEYTARLDVLRRGLRR